MERMDRIGAPFRPARLLMGIRRGWDHIVPLNPIATKWLPPPPPARPGENNPLLLTETLFVTGSGRGAAEVARAPQHHRAQTQFTRVKGEARE